MPYLFSLLFLLIAFQSAIFAQKPEKLMIEYKKLYTYTQDSLRNYYKNNKIPKKLAPVRNDVDMYEITYYGKWIDSSYIKAKGVLYVPVKKEGMDEFVYCHGTRISVDQSYGIRDREQFIPILMASDGYLSYFPFYFGLAGGEKEHIYQHTWTEASAVIHMIKACREIFSSLQVATTGKLFVSGYSQGGHATMAVQKHIEAQTFGTDITITASSALSGAYDMSGVQATTMFREFERPHYLPYLLISFNYAYKMVGEEAYWVFKPPYDTEIKELFKQPRTTDYQRIDDILPKVPASIVRDTFLDLYQNDPDFIFRKKFSIYLLEYFY
jgi:hypothetical protein